jgi:quinoprotein glucose dehydrogenase
MIRAIAIKTAAALTFAIAAALVFGGSLPAVIGGADTLNIAGVANVVADAPRDRTGWSHYGGDAGGARYSSAAHITRDNVRDLKIAWEYRTGDSARPEELRRQSAAEGTPILVDDALIFCTPYNEVISVDPGSGRENWRFDPVIDTAQRPANQFICRGVTYWRDATAAAGAACAGRIFMGTNDSRLIALDATTGERCASFGDNGEVVIEPGMDLVWPGEFQITSPPAVIGDHVVIGSAISDNMRVAAPFGVVRAHDARTGALRWTFDPIPRAAPAANFGDWRGDPPPVEGHANVWAPMAVDEARGLIFLPTTSPSPDFFGGLRPGDNRFANSVVALDGASGEVAWHFQTVHHDVWDYDNPAQPGLYSVWRDGARRDVVAQVTKQGLVFVLDRDTGEPFLPVEERTIPQNGAHGETLSPTQPFPVLTPGVVPDRVAPEDAFGLTLIDRKICERKIREARADGLYTPPSEQGTLVYPFNAGGANWGGAAFDASRNLLVVNMSNAAHHVQLIPAENIDNVREVFHDSEIGPQTGAPYGVKREVLLSPFGLPCTPPPWGVIAGIDLDSGEIVWRNRLGTTKDVAGGLALGLGTPNVGGPAITAGGLVFIGAAMDNYLRAFDVATGEEVWKGRLPAGGQATPMIYEWRGRQYVVIYAGGQARMGTTLGDSLVAFALPE